jgi:hypothetical protein
VATARRRIIGRVELQEVIGASPRMREAWEAFVAARRVYVEALRALGLTPQLREEVANTSTVWVRVTPADRVR